MFEEMPVTRARILEASKEALKLAQEMDAPLEEESCRKTSQVRNVLALSSATLSYAALLGAPIIMKFEEGWK